jgi:hypothetical protein
MQAKAFMKLLTSNRYTRKRSLIETAPGNLKTPLRFKRCNGKVANMQSYISLIEKELVDIPGYCSYYGGLRRCIFKQ